MAAAAAGVVVTFGALRLMGGASSSGATTTGSASSSASASASALPVSASASSNDSISVSTITPEVARDAINTAIMLEFYRPDGETGSDPVAMLDEQTGGAFTKVCPAAAARCHRLHRCSGLAGAQRGCPSWHVQAVMDTGGAWGSMGPGLLWPPLPTPMLLLRAACGAGDGAAHRAVQ